MSIGKEGKERRCFVHHMTPAAKLGHQFWENLFMRGKKEGSSSPKCCMETSTRGWGGRAYPVPQPLSPNADIFGSGRRKVTWFEFAATASCGTWGTEGSCKIQSPVCTQDSRHCDKKVTCAYIQQLSTFPSWRLVHTLCRPATKGKKKDSQQAQEELQ
eukprot:276820-Pelagomonas_calceolata.AAC.7